MRAFSNFFSLSSRFVISYNMHAHIEYGIDLLSMLIFKGARYGTLGVSFCPLDKRLSRSLRNFDT
jgi:hypothetical protein